MSTRKSRRSIRKPGDTPKEPPMDSRANFQLIIRDNLIKFLGRRFPEFCILQVVCRVSSKASSSTTGDARVASYKAAIDSVAARYYAHRPFMVEVLKKWLEINKDFVRDPLGYAASNSLPTPPPSARTDHPTISTIRDAPDHTLASTLTSNHVLAQIPSTVVNSPPVPTPKEAEVPDHIADSSPLTSTSGMEPCELDDPPSSTSPSDGRNVRVSIHRIFLFTWTNFFRFLPPLWNLVVGTLSSVVSLGPRPVLTSRMVHFL